jgi:hypothetical protein
MTTFVLVHGAWHGGWCYKRVARLLKDFNRWMIAGFGTTVKKPSQNRPEMGISGGLNAISGGLNGGSKTAKRLSTRAFLTPKERNMALTADRRH